MAKVIAELQKQGWQSDQRFAENYVRARWQRGHGPVRIRYELQQKGLAPELIDATLSRSGIDWEQALERIYRQKYANKPITNPTERAKRWRFLQQRGFAYEQIHRLLDD